MSDEKTPIEKRGPEFDLGDLARANAERGGLPAATLRLAVEQIAELLPDVLAQHGRVEIPGLGVFTLGHRYTKTADGQCVLTGKKKIRFRPAVDLQRAVGIE